MVVYISTHTAEIGINFGVTHHHRLRHKFNISCRGRRPRRPVCNGILHLNIILGGNKIVRFFGTPRHCFASRDVVPYKQDLKFYKTVHFWGFQRGLPLCAVLRRGVRGEPNRKGSSRRVFRPFLSAQKGTDQSHFIAKHNQVYNSLQHKLSTPHTAFFPKITSKISKIILQ